MCATTIRTAARVRLYKYSERNSRPFAATTRAVEIGYNISTVGRLVRVLLSHYLKPKTIPKCRSWKIAKVTHVEIILLFEQGRAAEGNETGVTSCCCRAPNAIPGTLPRSRERFRYPGFRGGPHLFAHIHTYVFRCFYDRSKNHSLFPGSAAPRVGNVRKPTGEIIGGTGHAVKRANWDINFRLRWPVVACTFYYPLPLELQSRNFSVFCNVGVYVFQVQ